jgi:hypothetical protein
MPKQQKPVVFAGKAPDKELPELRGPLQVRLLDPDSKDAVLDKRELTAVVEVPKDYVRVTSVFYDAESNKKNKLSVRLKATTPLSGPPCRARLVLSPERIPGFKQAERGTFEGTVPASGEGELELFAEELQFADDRSDDNGIIALDIDGYSRAYQFSVTFAGRGKATPRELAAPDLRVLAPRFVQPNKPCPIAIEVDNAPRGTQVEIALDRTGKGDFELQPRLVGDRRQRIGFSPYGPDGGLSFENNLTDWTLDLNTEGIKGRRDVRARLFINDEPKSPVTRPIIIDPTEPDLARFAKINEATVPEQVGQRPVEVKRADSLDVRLLADDPESGVRDVVVFFGRPMDGKPPASTQPVKAQESGTAGSWQAELFVPEDMKGVVPVTLLATNNVGLSKFATVLVKIMEPTKPSANGSDKPKQAKPSIAGIVVLGELRQPGITVTLLDEMGKKVLKTTTTDDEGNFLFKDLAPGNYQVTSKKTPRSAKKEVQLEEGQKAKIKLELAL